MLNPLCAVRDVYTDYTIYSIYDPGAVWFFCCCWFFGGFFSFIFVFTKANHNKFKVLNLWNRILGGLTASMANAF